MVATEEPVDMPASQPISFRAQEGFETMSRLGTPGTPASPGTRIGPYWKRRAGASSELVPFLYHPARLRSAAARAEPWLWLA